MKTWLVIDSSYLAYRAYYSMGDLSYEGEPTGVVYGFLQQIEILKELHDTENVAFCFDHEGPTKRHEIYPEYKSGRADRMDMITEEELEARREVHRQVKLLESSHLPRIGYRNIFSAQGYEGDDLIASFVFHSIGEDDEAIIITSDKDMCQCLRDNIWIYNPHTKKVTTRKSFKKKWEIDPETWPNVLALAGDRSDDIEGIRGIGMVRASQWFSGKLKPTMKAYQSINTNLRIHNRNIKLTKLPFPKCPVPQIRDDHLSRDGYNEVADELGFKESRRSMI